MTRSMKPTNRNVAMFGKQSSSWSPLTDRTVDLLLTMATPHRPDRTTSTEGTPERSESTECTRWTADPVHDSFHDHEIVLANPKLRAAAR